MADDDWTQCQQEHLKRLAQAGLNEIWKVGQTTIHYAGKVQAAVGDFWAGIYEGGVKLVDSATDWASRSVPRIMLTTDPYAHTALAGNSKAAPASPTNGEAYAWFTLSIPPDAAFLVFDFTVSGEGNEDCLAFGMNGTNVFSLKTKFVEENVSTSSSMIDVTSFAGQQVEAFLGILGGTSTNMTVAVDGLRFYSVERPTLSLSNSMGQAIVSWPVSASGFTLESATTLSPDAHWNPVANTSSIVDAKYMATIPLTATNRFFRLRQSLTN